VLPFLLFVDFLAWELYIDSSCEVAYLQLEIELEVDVELDLVAASLVSYH
jgi:hypothetical protein